MKYAVISDIHGNSPALQAVLEDIRRQGISHCLFAGDYCISGPWPDQCIETIRAIPEKTVIRGNEEKYLENLDYLRGLPHTADFECNGVMIHMAHSSTAFMGTYPFYTWNSVTVAEKNRQAGADPEKILRDIRAEWEHNPGFQEAVAGLEKGIYLFGHSHIQWSYVNREKGIFLVNPGSCGLPLDGIRDSVPYTVLEITESGDVKIEEKRIPFDKAAYISAVRQTGQYREAGVWTRVIMRELAAAQEHVFFFLSFAEQYANEIQDSRRPFSLETWEKAFEIWDRQQGESSF